MYETSQAHLCLHNVQQLEVHGLEVCGEPKTTTVNCFNKGFTVTTLRPIPKQFDGLLY